MLSEMDQFLGTGNIVLLPRYTTCTQHGMLIRDGMLFHPIAHVGDRWVPLATQNVSWCTSGWGKSCIRVDSGNQCCKLSPKISSSTLREKEDIWELRSIYVVLNF